MILGSYLIIGVSVLFPVGVTVTYVLSASAGHVKYLWCFISYTGNYPVESCIFSAVLNLCSAMYFLIVVLRYCQISVVLENSGLPEKPLKRMRLFNRMSLLFGLSGATGLSITGCFQQRNVHFVHMLGVGCCTCGTNIYFLVQTYFSFTLMSARTKASVKILRLLLVVLSSTCLTTGALMVLYNLVRNPNRMFLLGATVGANTDLHKAGTILEWVLFFLLQCFIYSFWGDFRKIGLKRNQILFLD